MFRSITAIVAICPIGLFATPRSAAQPAQFIPLGFLPGGGTTEAYGVSADGSVVVGRSISSGTHAFRWTAGGGMQTLLNLSGRIASGAFGINGDGSVIVGYSTSGMGVDQACRWNAAGQMTLLTGLPGTVFSAADGASSDGTAIVGWCLTSAQQATRWAPSAQSLGDLPGGDSYADANAASSDGAVVVGMSRSSSGTEAFRWTAAGGMVGLGDLPGGSVYSVATDTNADGTVVVGMGNGPSAATGEAFRWTQAGGMQGLGFLPGATSSSAGGISGDGAVIVGSSGRAFVWRAATDMIDLRDHLIANGATGLTGWTLDRANAISVDGRCIVGGGRNPDGVIEAWMAILPTSAPCMGDLNGDSVVDLNDLTLCLSDFGCPQPGHPSCPGDIDGDGDVDLPDLAVLLAHFGVQC